jgi:deazaflavin-dependent oxidoreductase (nitroreductase family)
MSTSPEDFNASVIEQFRANGGRVDGMPEGAPLLLLHTTGAKSGRPHVTPVMYVPDDGRYAIFASKGGAPTNPAWYHNLKAHPDAAVELGSDTVEVTAREATGEEHDRLYRAISERMPQFAEYQRNTDRVIPVIVLTPTGTG